MLKHIGRHGDKKVIVAFNKVPGEDHMALVLYSDSLPSMIHDEVMKVVEGQEGQQAMQLADALFRHIMPDGQNTLNAIHGGGYLKKVQTKQVILQPNAKSNVRLDELNKILDQMAGGDEAVKKMAEIDAGRGFADPEKDGMGPELGEGYRKRPPAVNPTQGGNQPSTRAGAVTGADVLSDADLANMNVEQAKQLESQAKTLMAEAKRLKAEATSLKPKAKKAKNVGKSKKTKATA